MRLLSSVPCLLRQLYTCSSFKLVQTPIRETPVVCSLSSQSAVLAALLNISIPLELGRLVNAVAQLSPGEEVRDSLRQLVPAGLRLGGLYLTQVRV